MSVVSVTNMRYGLRASPLFGKAFISDKNALSIHFRTSNATKASQRLSAVSLKVDHGVRPRFAWQKFDFLLRLNLMLAK